VPQVPRLLAALRQRRRCRMAQTLRHWARTLQRLVLPPA
jgi:hypothetical protein